MNRSRQARGRFGEDLAARWYRDQGFEIVDRNWRTREGELDLVAERGRLVAVCEVKARASLDFGHPFEAISPAKLTRLRRLAIQWLRDHDRHGVMVRLDVAAVIGARLEVLEGVDSL